MAPSPSLKGDELGSEPYTRATVLSVTPFIGDGALSHGDARAPLVKANNNPPSVLLAGGFFFLRCS